MITSIILTTNPNNLTIIQRLRETDINISLLNNFSRSTVALYADLRLDYSLFRFLRFVRRQCRKSSGDFEVERSWGKRSLKSMWQEGVFLRVHVRACVCVYMFPQALGECKV